MLVADDVDAGPPAKRKKVFQQVEPSDEPLPEELRHIRDSERKVKDNFYRACGDLSGLGLSIPEAAGAAGA